jgi:hypothetical protein
MLSLILLYMMLIVHIKKEGVLLHGRITSYAI